MELQVQRLNWIFYSGNSITYCFQWNLGRNIGPSTHKLDWICQDVNTLNLADRFLRGMVFREEQSFGRNSFLKYFKEIVYSRFFKRCLSLLYYFFLHQKINQRVSSSQLNASRRFRSPKFDDQKRQHRYRQLIIIKFSFVLSCDTGEQPFRITPWN